MKVLLEEYRAVRRLHAHRRRDHGRDFVRRVRFVLRVKVDALVPILVVDAHDVLDDTARALETDPDDSAFVGADSAKGRRSW